MGIRKSIWLIVLLCSCLVQLSAQTRQVIQAEYFWDTDPGPGNGIAMQATDGSFNEAIESIFRNNLTLPAVGMHRLGIRVKDYLGNWSPVYTTVVEIQAQLPIARGLQVIQAEYFWGTDPGVGNGTPMLAFDGNFNESIEALTQNLTTFPGIGAHKLSIRIRSADNLWGPAFATVVFVQTGLTPARPVSVTTAEYFWNTDPGQGNATAMLAFDGNFNQAIETALANMASLPQTGTHKLSIRVRAANNSWSPLYSTVVQVQPTLPANRPVSVSAAEYFWNTDPGQGNATAMLAFDGNFNQAIETALANLSSLPATGNHKLSIRVKDATNNWGPVFSTVVQVQAPLAAPRPVRVSLAECYFDTDPGTGNGTPMLAFDGNFNQAIETLTGGNLPTPVTAGWHALYIRVRDGAQNWGPAFGVVVEIDTTIGGFFALINGPLQLCETSLNNHAYQAAFHAGTNYTWSVTGGTLTQGATPNLVTVNWSAAGTHTLQVIECTANGAYCDTAQVVVTVADTQLVAVFDTICQGQSVVIGGNTVTSAGNYPVVYTNTSGCDSTVVTHLHIKPSPTTVISQTICQGQSFLGYSVSGTYNDVFSASNACDSTRTLNLTVLAPDTTYLSVTICPGQDYHGYTVAGTYQDLFNNASGCDSLRILTLAVSSQISTTINRSICLGDTLDGYWQAGVYLDTFVTSFGCDSFRTLNLAILPVIRDTITATICAGGNVEGYTTTGFHVDTFTAANGCDSIRVVDLTVLPSPNIVVDQIICAGQSFEGYTATGQYIDTFSLGSCDSIRTLNLTVGQPDTAWVTIAICAGQNYHGYTVTGNYIDTLATSLGCDSIRYLDLTVNPVYDTIITLTICEGETAEGYDTTGVYVDIFSSVSGCDSMRTLHLTVQPLIRDTTVTTICDGDSVWAGGEWQTLAGWYVDTTGFTANCPDLIYTDLRIIPTPATPVVYGFGDTLTTDIGPYDYQWFLEGDLLPGETNLELYITENGRYTVEVINADGCRKMSNIFVVNWVGITDYAGALWRLDYYPNPTQDQITILVQGVEQAQLSVMSGLGQQLYQSSLTNNTPHVLDMGHWAAGIYYLQVQQGDKRQTKKVIKVD